ncbi:MAG: hypothetical protein K2Y32_12225 [Candidatus Obscuribacterales bacterium]|nr:hypothetical protein [Candidatus Obscuribacterales bacterium]
MDPRLEAAFRSSASWFFWMAGCTVVNLFMFITKSNFGLALGMSDSLIVAVVNLLRPPAGDAGALIVIASNVLYIALMAVFGIFAGKGKVWAFAMGISLALIDGIYCLSGGEYIGTIVHGMAVWFIFSGLRLAIAVRNASPEELLFATANAGVVSPGSGGPSGPSGSGLAESCQETAGDGQTDSGNQDTSKAPGPKNPIS